MIFQCIRKMLHIMKEYLPKMCSGHWLSASCVNLLVLGVKSILLIGVALDKLGLFSLVCSRQRGGLIELYKIMRGVNNMNAHTCMSPKMTQFHVCILVA